MYSGDNKQAATGVPMTSAPPFPGQYPNAPGAWSVGAFDCCSDMSTCCITCWCPCITFGKIAEIVDRGSTSCGASGALYALIYCVTGCGWIYSCFYRERMRSQYNLDDGPCGDCLLHCCCEPCALVQEYRELQNRGFNMALGWHGNMERNAGVAMAPQFEGGMRR